MLDLAIFYCQHQTDRMLQILGTFRNLAAPRIRKVALPCSGKLEISFLLKALENGADAVALFGCPEGECHYLVGSTRAKNRVRYAQKILREIGLGEERVRRFAFADQTPGEMDSLTAWTEKIQSMSRLHENSKIRRQE
jgi:F420-non-reducing hydrogenase iron-sulfur subunit